MSQRNDQQSVMQEPRAFFYLLLHLMAIFLKPLEAGVRKAGTAGKAYFTGIHALLAIPFLLIWGKLSSVSDRQAECMLLMVLCYVVVCLIHRAKYAGLRYQGVEPPHSRYIGDSDIRGFFWWKTDEQKKKYAEPLLCFLIGLFLMQFWLFKPLGLYFFWGTFALMFNYRLMQRQDDARAQAMIDARWDQGSVIQRYNELTGRS